MIAIGLAFVLWATFGYQRNTIRRNFYVPLKYKNMPAKWHFSEPPVKEVKVTLQKPEQAFRLMNADSLKLSLDLSALAQKKLKFSLNRDIVNAPPGLSIAEISPSKIRIYTARQIAAHLPVHVTTVNEPPNDLALQKISVRPTALSVMLNPKINPNSLRLETETLNLQNITSTGTFTLKVKPLSSAFFPNGKSPQVQVTVRVRKK